MNLLNAGCGTHYAKGWVNTDVWESDTTKPDLLVATGQPYPFEDNYFDAVFLGHVLEHIPWVEVPNFLDDMSRIAKPGAPFLVVGPDVFKTINRWKDGQEPWWMVESVLEHQDQNWQPGRTSEWWDGAHHHWNCHHARVELLLTKMGFTDLVDVANTIPKDTQGSNWEHEGINWPVVGHWHWHFAILCKNK